MSKCRKDGGHAEDSIDHCDPFDGCAGSNSAEGGYADRNRDYRHVGIVFVPEFKPKLVVMMNMPNASQLMIFPPQAVRKLGI